MIADLPDLTSTTDSRIGTDESGKGDFFGPLVVAAVCADFTTGTRLTEWGITDSKKLSDGRARKLADQIITAKIPHAIVAIGPERYNELHTKMRNLNRLLAWAHARAIENLLDKVSATTVIADQFGDESLIERALMEKGKMIHLFQMPRGERDIAVAAASVLARAEFLHRLDRLSSESGIKLPKGAGPPVDIAAADLLRRVGTDGLKRFAKCHFRNTQKAVALQQRQS